MSNRGLRMANNNQLGLGLLLCQVPSASLECPVCFEVPTGEIVQCGNGHSICVSCSGKLVKCPLCNVAMAAGGVKVRNRTMEQVIGSAKMSCKYQPNGCKVMVSGNDSVEHFNSCKFKEFQLCQRIPPFKSCAYASSKSPEIFDHLIKVHGCGLRTCTSAAFDMKDHVADMMKGKSRKGGGGVFLLTTRTGTAAKFLCWSHTKCSTGDFMVRCLYFGDENDTDDVSPFLVTLNVFSPDKEVKWSWTGRPLHYKKIDTVMESPPLRVAIKSLVNAVSPCAANPINLKYGMHFRER